METTTFITTDASDRLFSYYDEMLKKEGWTPSLGTGHVYGVGNCCYYGTVSVDVESGTADQSKVIIKTFWSVGCG